MTDLLQSKCIIFIIVSYDNVMLTTNTPSAIVIDVTTICR